MFNLLGKLKEMKEKIKDIRRKFDTEIEECDTFLNDLPDDIKDIKELENIIGNNKDMARAYDLGRKEAFESAKRMTDNI